MLEASRITYRVGNKALISEVSARFARGMLHLVIGPNGAGKSTLIKVLARLLRPDTGKVEYEGDDVPRKRIRSCEAPRGALTGRRSCVSADRA